MCFVCVSATSVLGFAEVSACLKDSAGFLKVLGFENCLRVCQLFVCANCVHKHLPGCVRSEFSKTGMFMIFVSFDCIA